jgi:hypothetical protein
MSYKLIDFRNTSYIDGNQDLYNIEEIIQNIRRTTKFSSLWLQLVFSLFTIAIALILYQTLRITIIQGSSPILGILFSLILLAGIAFFGYMIFDNMQWREGIRDKQILEKLYNNGKVTQGTITQVSEGILTYRFELGEETVTSEFLTSEWQNFDVGDKVAVLHIDLRVYSLL